MSDATELETHSELAERGLIGALIVHGDSLAMVLSNLAGSDFYGPARGLVWDACRRLSLDGMPLNPMTVGRAMTAAGTYNGLVRHVVTVEMLSGGDSPVFAQRHADMITELAHRRELIQVTNHARHLASDYPGTASETLAKIRECVEGVKMEDVDVAGPLAWEPMMDQFFAAHEPGAAPIGIASPWWQLDQLIGGLFPGRVYILGGRPGSGKALAVDTPIATPEGWAVMGDLRDGDMVFGADGRPTRVVHAFDVMYDRPCFEVEFSDGSVIVADADHQWLTATRASRRAPADDSAPRTSKYARDQRDLRAVPSVVTTAEIASTLRLQTADARLNHSIATTAALDLPEAELVVPPYTLGLWLGDGTSSAAAYTSADPEIAMFVEADGFQVVPLAPAMRYAIKLPKQEMADRACMVCDSPFLPRYGLDERCSGCRGARASSRAPRHGYCPSCAGPSSGLTGCRSCRADHGSVTALLRKIGVLNNKHIPADYLRASESQRRALLAGLLDSDGTTAPGGQVQFCVTSHRLAQGARELVVSLGYRATWSTKRVKGRTPSSSIAYAVSFSTADDVFRLNRKQVTHKERRASSTAYSRSRYISAVRAVPSVPVRCIAVENADHLYLAGKSMISTHNSTAAINVALHVAVQSRKQVLVVSKEMPTVDVAARLLSAGTEVSLAAINGYRLDVDTLKRLVAYSRTVKNPPLTVDDTSRSLAGIVALARAHHHRHGLGVLVVDYLQLVRTDKASRSRENEVAEVSMTMKALALELRCSVILPAQLNRGSVNRADPKPTMSDLRDSGQIEQDADAVVLLHRELTDQGEPTGKILFILDKNRHGPTAEIKLDWRGNSGRIN